MQSILNDICSNDFIAYRLIFSSNYNYRGVDNEGRPIMVVVGAQFLL
jgi:hypothetical protein